MQKDAQKPLMVHNTLTKQKEEFRPIHGKKVFMYVCGPTVYDYCHIGHARSYVAFDVIRRYMEHKGYTVIYVQNFTDVDDKIINRAKENGEDPLELSRRFTRAYFEDMDRLHVRRANIHPKVSDHIPEIIEMVSALIKKGHAYEVGGSVYFAVESAKDKVGKLSNQTLEDLVAGSRVEIDESKRNPLDFALWKAAKPGEISWDSPWGKGRPGWHIECSTMSMQYLGATLDIHGGGMDLVFPHHESEILQSECYSGKDFAKYWLHNGFITINKEKMSKSLGNFFTVREVLDKYRPEVLRFFLLYTHYRSPIDFSDKLLDEAKQGYGRLVNTLQNLRDLSAELKGAQGSGGVDPAVQTAVDGAKNKFYGAMDDDFNTREAIAAIFELSSAANDVLSKKTGAGQASVDAIISAYDDFGSILGLFHEHKKGQGGADKSNALIKLLLSVREDLRKKKDFASADAIRDKLKETGFLVEDAGAKTKIR